MSGPYVWEEFEVTAHMPGSVSVQCPRADCGEVVRVGIYPAQIQHLIEAANEHVRERHHDPAARAFFEATRKPGVTP